MFFENFIIFRSYMTVFFHFLMPWILRHKKYDFVFVITILCIFMNAVQLKPIEFLFKELKKQLWAWNMLFRKFDQNFLKPCWFALCDERRKMNVLNNWQLITWFCLIIFLGLWDLLFCFRGSSEFTVNTEIVLADWIILSI